MKSIEISKTLNDLVLPGVHQPEDFGQLWKQFDQMRTTISALEGPQAERDQLHHQLTAKRIDAYLPVANHVARTHFGTDSEPVAIGTGFACVVYKIEDHAVSVGSAYWRYLRRQLVSSMAIGEGVPTPRTIHVGKDPIPFAISELAPGRDLQWQVLFEPSLTPQAQAALRSDVSFKIGAMAKGLGNITFDEFGWRPALSHEKYEDLLQGVCRTWAQYVDWKYQKTPAWLLSNGDTRSAWIDTFTAAGWTLSQINGTIDTVADIKSWNLTPTLTHGDLHPWNIKDHEGQLSLLDWGEARAAGGIIEELADWRFLDAGFTEEDLEAALHGYGLSGSEHATGIARIKQLEVLEEMYRLQWNQESEIIPRLARLKSR